MSVLASWAAMALVAILAYSLTVICIELTGGRDR